ncbi:MAG TPA: glycosyltransferase family 4 protein [Deltaproteobacteria bacterium]|nr:glycosyltransferase family 4 protein [Deltaproteobacteria bacterium]
MNNSKYTLITISAGMSMAEMNRAGLISRELGYFSELSGHIGRISFLSYDRDRDREQELLTRYFPSSTIEWSLPAIMEHIRYGLFFASWLPPLYKNHFNGCRLIRSEQLSGAWTGALLARRLQVPFILRCGYLFSPEFAKEHSSIILNKIFFAIEGFVARSARAIIVTYPGAKDFFIQRHKIPAEKIHVLGNPVDTELFRPLGKVPDRGGINVARFTQQKNLFSLIKAAAKTGTSLTLVGRGPLEQELKVAAENEGADLNLRPPVLNHTLPELMAKHSMFIFPSLWEGNPKALIEAMACGLPCIASNIPENNHLIDDGVHGLLSSSDPDDIARCITILKNDPDLAKKLGDNARRKILQEYSMASIAEREGNLHRKILENNR